MHANIFHIVFACALLLVSPVQAAMSARILEAQLVVVTFAHAPNGGGSVAGAIDQAKGDIPRLADFTLENARALAPLMEKLSEGSVRMVIVIAPDDQDAITKIPGIYPDIRFVFIDMPEPFYAANVQTVQFKNGEGYFLLGTIAGLSADKRIALVSQRDDEQMRSAFAMFTRGVHHIKPKLEVKEYYHFFKAASDKAARLDMALADLFKEGASLLFSMDDDIAQQALKVAKQERKMVIYRDKPSASADTERLLTHMVKRHDLALLDVVRIYSHNQWRAGNTVLGVNGGYIDYALGQDNVDLFPKESIDEIEAIKDYIGQGLLTQ